MKKSTLILAAIVLCIGYGVLSWDIVSHSAPPGSEDSQFAGICSTTTTPDNAAPSTTYNMCCIDYNEALDAVKRDWQASLQKLINQEEAASDMVDDGYESLRTYNCWVEYICRAVQYSGHAPIESAIGTGLTSEHLGIVPGCQKADNLKMEKEYNTLMQTMKEIPIVGILPSEVEKTMIENKINFFPRCMTDPNDNRSPNIVQAKSQYDACKRALEMNFGCSTGIDEVRCVDRSTAFVTLETILKKKQGDQKAAALEKKLGTIVPKLQDMEAHVGYLSNFLNQLDARFSCYAGKCS